MAAFVAGEQRVVVSWRAELGAQWIFFNSDSEGDCRTTGIERPSWWLGYDSCQ